VFHLSYRWDRYVVLCSLALASWACGEEGTPTAPVTLQAAALSSAEAASPVCPARPDFVVDDAGSLAAALAAAAPGGVIAVRGMIELPGDLVVEVEGLRLTCAERGAGLRAEPGAVGFLVHVPSVKNVTVDHLVLDAREANEGAILTGTGPQDGSLFADGARFISNRVLCAAHECTFFQSPDYAAGDGYVVEDNDITATQTWTGIHIQGVRNVRVARNRVSTEAGGEAGIMVNGVEDVQLVDNEVEGPWDLGMHLLDGVTRGRIASNRVRGPELRGFLMTAVADLTIDKNDVECGSQSCGRFEQLARLKVTNNRFNATAALVGLIFFQGVEAIDVSENRIVTTDPSTNPNLGGLRIQGTTGARVVGNIIEGPWVNGMSLAQMTSSDVLANRVSGALRAGMLLIQANGNSASGNTLGAGELGLGVSSGCSNRLQGNSGAVANGPFLSLAANTGANRAVLPSPALTWVDLGARDCDGDGTTDANTIVGGVPYS